MMRNAALGTIGELYQLDLEPFLDFLLGAIRKLVHYKMYLLYPFPNRAPPLFIVLLELEPYSILIIERY